MEVNSGGSINCPGKVERDRENLKIKRDKLMTQAILEIGVNPE